MIALQLHIWKIMSNRLIQFMKNQKIRNIAIVAIILFSMNTVFAQGISRSSGIGIRASIRKPHNIGSEVNVGAFPITTTVGSGEGGYVYYYTRLKENWYLETMFGGTGTINITKVGTLGTYSAQQSITPLLFGLRNDFLSLEHGSIFQPYWAFGGGLHWISAVKTGITRGIDTSIGNESQIGVYVGTGLNALLSSRFALNADLKYHLLKFDPEAEYSGFEYSFGLTYMWGDNPEIFRVAGIKVIVQNIYPSYYQFYNTSSLEPLSGFNAISNSQVPVLFVAYHNREGSGNPLICSPKITCT